MAFAATLLIRRSRLFRLLHFLQRDLAVIDISLLLAMGQK